MKRILPIFVVIVMLLGTCVGVSANERTVISISGELGYQEINHSGEVLKPTIIVKSGPTPASYLYEWYVEKDNVERKRPWETSNTFVISTMEPASIITVEVTPLDENDIVIGDTARKHYFAFTWFLGKIKGYGEEQGFTKEVGTNYQNTPKDLLFEVDGIKYIMLDALNDGTYYIMTEDAVKQMPFDTSGRVIFDSENANNVAHWLNNDYINGEQFPQSLKEHVIKNKTWTTEQPHDGAAEASGSQYWGQYDKTATIGLMSCTEFQKYLGRFGLWINNYQDKKFILENGGQDENGNPYEGDSGWWLRSANEDPNPASIQVSQQSGWDGGADNIVGKVGKDISTAKNYWVRPTFYLSENFFKSVKLDLSKMGDGVKTEIYRSLGSELLNVYTEEELIVNGFMGKPTVGNCNISGNFKVGNIVKASYDYEQKDGVQEGKSIKQFAISDTPNGEFKIISEGSNEYIATENDMGKYIKFIIQPVDIRGARGELYESKTKKIQGVAEVIATEGGIYDESGKEANIMHASTFCPKVTLKNITSSKKEAIVMMAVYNQNGDILDNTVKSIIIPENGTVDVNDITLQNPVYQAGNNAKLIVWESLSSMKSIYDISK